MVAVSNLIENRNLYSSPVDTAVVIINRMNYGMSATVSFLKN